ncbi:MAG: Asp-tRNA(Asn)/Glu-tRNA(Gln) amidotransferase subunit GatA [Candidatus Marinimicrobia bacterium]|nr:Asp-tRNA(Asn)/Glu-tRNA(Gln) amidotransferase subunit GatA [Candidatus Neomarinimicrobiota bacterium]
MKLNQLPKKLKIVLTQNNNSLNVNQLTEKIKSTRDKISRESHLNCITADLTKSASSKVTSLNTDGALFGKTIAIKDNLNLINTPTTCASKILNGHDSVYTATSVQKIIDAQGSIVAKTNMDEFAMGSSNEHSVYGPTKNPHNTDYVPGGSSGGSAVAVAAGIVDMALGSDTGGSVRQPASFCGVYGLKPTYGRVSRYGLTAFASSFDQVGVFANTVEDTVSLFEVIAGHDESDSTSANEPVEPFNYNENTTKKLRIGLPKEFLGEGIDPEIRHALTEKVEFLKDSGFEIIDVSLPNTEHAIASYYILTTAEASTNLSRFDGVRFGHRATSTDLHEMYVNSRNGGFGDEVKRRIMLGTFVLSSGYYDAYYTQAQKVRRLIRDDYTTVFNEVDVLLTPTSPILPFKRGEKLTDPLQMYMADVCTVPMSLAGVPALNIPTGKSKSNLPIGLQLTGNFFNENDLFSVAKFISEN